MPAEHGDRSGGRNARRDTTSLFAAVIQEHLELRRRNAALEHEMPLEKYMPDDPFENHPLFKTEEQARIEDTMDGAQSIVDEPTSLEWPAESRTRCCPTSPHELRPRSPDEPRCSRRGAPPRTSPTRASGRARATSTGATSTGAARRAGPARAGRAAQLASAPDTLCAMAELKTSDAYAPTGDQPGGDRDARRGPRRPASATRRCSARPAPARRRRWPGSSRSRAARRS